MQPFIKEETFTIMFEVIKAPAVSKNILSDCEVSYALDIESIVILR